jgi:hypothetical protein
MNHLAGFDQVENPKRKRGDQLYRYPRSRVGLPLMRNPEVFFPRSQAEAVVRTETRHAFAPKLV